jgi:hypothetical protein
MSRASDNTDWKTKFIHLQDDCETLRSQVLRTIRLDIDLLTSASRALEKGKSHIVEDHLDRVRSSLLKLGDDIK